MNALSAECHPFFANRRVVFALATLCCLFWGSSYPAIKGGYALFEIARDDIPSKLLFAGWRFVLAGIVLLGFALATGKTLLRLNARQWRDVTQLGLFQTTIHYVFFYVGLANTTGVKGSVLNGAVSFFGWVGSFQIAMITSGERAAELHGATDHTTARLQLNQRLAR